MTTEFIEKVVAWAVFILLSIFLVPLIVLGYITMYYFLPFWEKRLKALGIV